MRHYKHKVTLDRPAAARRALLIQLSESLILSERVQTTRGKARAVRPFVERFIARARRGDLATRRFLLQRLHSPRAVKKLMDDIGPRYQSRPGGYTRLVKISPRLGDGAERVVVELV